MSDIMCDNLSELLLSAQNTMEGVRFSPDSGVFSSSDSEPSSPVLLTPSSILTPMTHEGSESFTQLANADLSAYTPNGDKICADWWLHTPPASTQGSGMFTTSCDGWEKDWQSAERPVSISGTHVNFVDGDWVETPNGFKICHTGDGKAQVKLTANHTYDIDINIDIPDNIPAVKPECGSEEAAVVYRKISDTTTNNNFNQYPTMDNINNNTISNNDNIFSYENCNSCVNNRNFYAVNPHCPASYHDVHPHPPSAVDRDPRDHDGRAPVRPRTGRQSVTRTERLWEFTLRLLGEAEYNPRLIEWVDRDDGMFRLNNSKAIAYMWGMRKNNTQMTYEKLSRALRYYYHRQILEPVLGKKLVYRFGPNALQVWKHRAYRPQGSR